MARAECAALVGPPPRRRWASGREEASRLAVGRGWRVEVYHRVWD